MSNNDERDPVAAAKERGSEAARADVRAYRQEAESRVRCDGCGEYSDRRPGEFKTYRPDGLADIFSLCPLCVRCVSAKPLARLRALMDEAVRDFHGKSCLFSAQFLAAAVGEEREP